MRHQDRVRVRVESEGPVRAEGRGGEREDPRAGADVEDPEAGRRLVFQEEEDQARRFVPAGAERGGSLNAMRPVGGFESEGSPGSSQNRSPTAKGRDAARKASSGSLSGMSVTRSKRTRESESARLARRAASASRKHATRSRPSSTNPSGPKSDTMPSTRSSRAFRGTTSREYFSRDIVRSFQFSVFSFQSSVRGACVAN
jgi:hypothetical protein